MNKIIGAFILLLLIGFPSPGGAENSQLGHLLISFDFNRAEQDYANNQFVVWIEDMDGQLIKTLFATQFTAKGGWRLREEALPEWTRKSGISKMKMADVDAISGATPKAGRLAFTWQGDNANGGFLPAGEYRYCVEANYYWDAMVVYRGIIRIGERRNSNRAHASYSSSDAKEYHLVENVSALYIPKKPKP